MRNYLLLLAVLFPSFAFAIGDQYGRINGIVYSPDGAELPGAKITIESKTLLGGPRTLLTKADGSFSFNTLPPGAYNLTATTYGFKLHQQTGVQVSVGKTTSLYIALQAGESTDIATGEPPIVYPDLMIPGTFTAELDCIGCACDESLVPKWRLGCSTQEDPTAATLFSPDTPSDLFPRVVYTSEEKRVNTFGFDSGAGFNDTLQKLPKHGQGLNDFVLLLPMIQAAPNNSPLYVGRPLQVIVDGMPLQPMTSRR
jgi:hypothetical protein